MKEIWLSIKNHEDRNNIVWGLSSVGVKVRVKDEQDSNNTMEHTYWVISEVPDNNIKEKKNE